MTIEKAVYSKPEKFAAYKLPDEPDLGLATMCNGSYVASADGTKWLLHIHGMTHGRPGDWLMMNEDLQFFIVSDENFQTQYVEKVSYENQSS